MGAKGQVDDMDRIFDDPYKNLAAAILFSAVNDIREYEEVEFLEKDYEPKGVRARRYKRFMKAQKEANEAYASAKEFLMSDLPKEWFGFDGSWVLRELEKENNYE